MQSNPPTVCTSRVALALPGSAALVTSLLMLTAPTASAEPGGGTAYGQAPAARPAPGQLTMRTRPAAILGQMLRFRGTVAPGDAGRRVIIERLKRNGEWTRETNTIARDDGKFLARWRTNHIGRFVMRARIEGTPAPTTGGLEAPEAAAPTSTAASTPTASVTVYRSALATWYGPGFYGRRTACGQRMTKELIGVAHTTLPCGTMVALMYRRRALEVPVVDRGPYSSATWDLTSATARALGFTGSGTIGAVRLRD